MNIARRRLRFAVEVDRSTLQWIVVEYHRTGFSVRGRFDNEQDALLCRHQLMVAVRA